MRNKWALLLIGIFAIAMACIVITTKDRPPGSQLPPPTTYTVVLPDPSDTNRLAVFVQQFEAATRSTSERKEQLYPFLADQIFPGRRNTGVEQAERLNLLQMQKYQRSALRTIYFGPAAIFPPFLNDNPENLK